MHREPHRADDFGPLKGEHQSKKKPGILHHRFRAGRGVAPGLCFKFI
jgi:hypothetical protein